MGCGLTCVDSALHKGFYRLGLIVGRHPGYFLIVPFLLTLLCITGFQRIKYEIDPEYLFSPVRGEGKVERSVVEQFFKPNYTSRFNVGRITRPGRFGRVIVVPRHGKDMLKREIFHELRMLDELIQNATVQWDDEEVFTYRDVCARWVDQCFQNDILNLDYIIDEVENRTLNLTFPIMFNPVTWDAHTFPVYFGGTVVSDEGLIISVPSIQLVYFVTADTKRQDARGAAWEEAFLNAVGKAEANHMFRYISTARFASRTLDIELERNTRTVVPYFSTTFIIMAVFSITACWMADWVRAKPWLGLMGNISACMGTAAAFGVVMYMGVEFIGINLAAPFLMLGIGIDDTFVMLGAWRRTSIQLSVPERMGRMLSEAAVSITITSVTDMISFWIGIISPFQSVRIFCIYSGFAVCFTFLWHVTFFAACVALAGYAEQKNLHSVVCVKVNPVSKSDKRSWLYRKFCTGGVDPSDPDNPLDNKEHCLMAYFRDSVAPTLNWWPVKVVVVIVFAFYIAGACYGIMGIQEGLERRKLSRSDSYSVEFYDREDFYFREFPYRIQVIITGELNYSDPIVQAQVENLTQTFENTSYISSPLYTESWLRSFVGYIHRNQDYLNVSIETEDEFINTLKEAVNISDTNGEKEMVRALRDICHQTPLNVSVFHPYFVFFDQCMVIGALVMMVVCFFFIPNILCCVWVALSIISIEAGVAGYMALWGVNLDSISMINLIMCIGFSVDFTAHICYAYMSSNGRTPEDRVKESLYALGLPIVQGASSTILAVVSLVLAGSYIFLVFFKMVFLVVFFGAMHGLFLLPVLLSLFGPGSCTAPKKKKNPSEKHGPDSKHPSEVEKSFPHPFCIPHPSLNPISHNNFVYRCANGDIKASSPQYFANGTASSYHPNLGSDGKVNKLGAAPHFGVPLPGLPSHMMMYNGGKYGDTSGSLEKDLGLGTSGEDSSESSSNKSQRRLQQREDAIEEREQRRRYEEGWRKSSSSHVVGDDNRRARPQEFQPPHLMEVYNNSGYLSDEGGRYYNRRDRASNWQRNHHHEDFRRNSPRSKSQNHRYHHHSRSVPGYIGEMKFP
ncbi:hypothetical protein C0J52_08794 [Blattella germanica]|nr:hypothetical protein C0J52_08794 [Blattella germanica]